jgi:nucleotide-binding universal stress UspA family protein
VADAAEEGMAARNDPMSAEQRLADLARKHGVSPRADQRVETGDPASLLGQIASEEAADIMVVGLPPKRWGRRRIQQARGRSRNGDAGAGLARAFAAGS